MNKKTTDILFKILLIIIAITLGWFLVFPITMHLVIFADFFANSDPRLIQQDFIPKALKVAVTAAVLSLGYFFAKGKFRYFFLMLPIITPSIFVMLYAINI
ncbi:MAG: hypothetical protein AAF244_04245 [Pseudomonadota bacterium]